MPFTPSHAVVALAFPRTPLVPAAVAVGAMTPDLPLFVPDGPLRYSVTHTFAWIPVTVVVALALLLVWRCVLRPAARELSPEWLARRLPADWDAGMRAGLTETFARRGRAVPSLAGTALLLVALAIGVASHIVWDLFTHEGRWGVELIPALTAAAGPVPGYKCLQHGSSAAGLAIIALWAVLWVRSADAAASVSRVLPTWVRWGCWLSLPALLLGALVFGYAAYGPFRTGFGVEHLAYAVLPQACAVWGVLVIGVCLAVVAAAAASRRTA